MGVLASAHSRLKAADVSIPDIDIPVGRVHGFADVGHIPHLLIFVSLQGLNRNVITHCFASLSSRGNIMIHRL